MQDVSLAVCVSAAVHGGAFLHYKVHGGADSGQSSQAGLFVHQYKDTVQFSSAEIQLHRSAEGLETAVLIAGHCSDMVAGL